MLVERDEQPLHLCTIARGASRRIAVEWSADALAQRDDHSGANTVVTQIPFMRGVHLIGKENLDGLVGFFADSLPEAWGRLIIDRALRERGIQPAALSGFDRLAIIGDRGPGALTYEPHFDLGEDRAELDLDRLASDAALAIEGDDVELLAELARIGGSAGGSRPKAWIAVTPEGKIRSGAGVLRPGEVGWLVKFRARLADPEDVGRLEYAYARMALAAGLEVAEPWLIETKGGAYFATRRFDRGADGRAHVLSAAGILNVSAQETMAFDYSDLLRLTRLVTRSETEVTEAYRHAVFNVLARNRDDHLRQFAFRRHRGLWYRAPAYDLTFSAGPGGQHTLLVAGEGRSPQQKHLDALAADAGVKTRAAQEIKEKVCDAISRWDSFAQEAGVSARSARSVANALGV